MNTLGARGFSCAVSGVGYVSIVSSAFGRTKLVFFAARVRKTREKPLVPRITNELLFITMPAYISFR